LEQCVKDKDEFTDAFKDLIKFIEKARLSHECNETNCKELEKMNEAEEE